MDGELCYVLVVPENADPLLALALIVDICTIKLTEEEIEKIREDLEDPQIQGVRREELEKQVDKKSKLQYRVEYLLEVPPNTSNLVDAEYVCRCSTFIIHRALEKLAETNAEVGAVYEACALATPRRRSSESDRVEEVPKTSSDTRIRALSERQLGYCGTPGRCNNIFVEFARHFFDENRKQCVKVEVRESGHDEGDLPTQEEEEENEEVHFNDTDGSVKAVMEKAIQFLIEHGQLFANRKIFVNTPPTTAAPPVTPSLAAAECDDVFVSGPSSGRSTLIRSVRTVVPGSFTGDSVFTFPPIQPPANGAGSFESTESSSLEQLSEISVSRSNDGDSRSRLTSRSSRRSSSSEAGDDGLAPPKMSKHMSVDDPDFV